jgi:16S rRNA (adenine1518-N6/adenine1519-N6)-dimethyltransferase
MTFSVLASPSATREVLMRHGLSTKKALGQHFLIDDHVVGRILDMADICQDDVVLEVGPGIGTLTVALLSAAQGVISIERDKDLPVILSETCIQDSDKLVLLVDDALKIDEDDIKRATPGWRLPRLFVANLPYAVAATIVLDFFERFSFLQEATVMVQSEVADRMAAKPGTKDYGAYTVKLRLHALIDGRFQVSPRCFFPPPRVESAVIHLIRRSISFDGALADKRLLDAASRAADAAFVQRRKTIRNSMAAYFVSRGSSKEVIDKVLVQAGIEPGIRGEMLTVEDYLRLGKVLIDFGML